MKARRFLVAGTDTGVGKTQVACALAALMAERGLSPFVFKPYESGIAEGALPADAVALREAAGSTQPLDTVCLYRYLLPLAPAVAAGLEKNPSSWAKVLSVGRRGVRGGATVVEGAGGLLSPLDDRHTALDLASNLELPVVLVGRDALGTLNHVTLCLEALRHRKITVAAVLLSQSSTQTDISRRTNLKWLSRTFKDVHFLKPMPFIADPRKRRHVLKRILSPLM